VVKNIIRKIIGNNLYTNGFGYLSDMYQTVFLNYKEPSIHLVKYFISKGDTIFDIGANIGRFTALAAPLVGKQGNIFSFEPLAYPCRILKHMRNLKRLKQVNIINLALSDSGGIQNITIPLKNGWKPKTALAFLEGENIESSIQEQVKLDTMDNFCDSTNLNRLDFIKCDVEGHEFKVFLGGIKTLVKFKPTIYCEIDKSFCTNNNIDFTTVFEWLKKMGYLSYLLKNNQLAFFNDYSSAKKKDEYFFVHESKKNNRIILS